METIYQSSHGNTLSIEFEYPEENPPNYLRDITIALNYAGVFTGIDGKMPPCNECGSWVGCPHGFLGFSNTNEEEGCPIHPRLDAGAEDRRVQPGIPKEEAPGLCSGE